MIACFRFLCAWTLFAACGSMAVPVDRRYVYAGSISSDTCPSYGGRRDIELEEVVVSAYFAGSFSLCGSEWKSDEVFVHCVSGRCIQSSRVVVDAAPVQSTAASVLRLVFSTPGTHGGRPGVALKCQSTKWPYVLLEGQRFPQRIDENIYWFELAGSGIVQGVQLPRRCFSIDHDSSSWFLGDEARTRTW